MHKEEPSEVETFSSGFFGKPAKSGVVACEKVGTFSLMRPKGFLASFHISRMLLFVQSKLDLSAAALRESISGEKIEEICASTMCSVLGTLKLRCR